MAFTVVQATTPSGQPGTGWSVSYTGGGTVQTDDDCFVFVTSRDHTAGTSRVTVTDNDTGGNAWALIAESTDRKASVFWKKATGSTSGKNLDVAGAVGSCAGGLLVIRGANTGGDPTTNISVEDNSSGDESHTGFTPDVADSMVVLAVFNIDNDNDVSSEACTTPGALTQQIHKTSNSGGDCQCSAATGIQTGGPTATGAFTWAQTNGATKSIVFAIKPPGEPTGSSGSGSPTATLSASAAGTSAQQFSGSGAPTATLSASATGSGTNTAPSNDVSGSGSPTATLDASASGTATRTLNDSSGSGSPSAALNVSASGTATHTPDSASGSGSPTATLSASASGTATRTLNDSSGSGSPSAALSASASGTATHTPDGTTYYVATDGSDSNPGTEAEPFLTIQHAVDVMVAGDTTIVEDGLYQTTSAGQTLVQIFEKTGSAGARFTLRARNEHGAILDGNGDGQTAVRINTDSQYWVIEGFEVRHFAVSATGASGITIYGDNIDNIIVRGCRIHSIAKDTCSDTSNGFNGIFVGSPGDVATNILIENNLIYNIGRLAEGEGSCTNGNTNWMNHDHGIYVAETDNITIINNRFWDNIRGWSIQRFNTGGHNSQNVLIANNSFAFENPNRDGHIIVATSTTGCRIENNIFYDPQTAGISITGGTHTSGSIKNNITFGGTATTGSTTGFTLSGNQNNTDPLLVSTGATPDFRLQSGSPARDAGLTLSEVTEDCVGTPRPQGSDYDIGAFEFTGDSSGSGSPSAALDADASGTATNTSDGITGSGSPAESLSTSASGTATLIFSASGSPSATLSKTADGSATHASDDRTGSGTPAVALSVSASGSASHTSDDSTGSGSPAVALSASASGSATRTVDEAIDFDAATEHLGSGSPQQFTHTPVGTPTGVVVFIFHTSSAIDRVTGVTYGGESMVRQNAQFDQTGDLGAAYVYTLDTDVPSGPQTVSISKTAAFEMHAVAITLIGSGAVLDTDGSKGQPNVENPSVTFQHGGQNALGFVGLWSGINGPNLSGIDDNAGQTRVHDHDFGAESSLVSRQNAATSSDTTLGYQVGLNNFAIVGVTFAAQIASSDSTGSGSPSATLDTSASGTATQSFSGTAAPSTTLATSATGTATNTPPVAGDHNGSGSPTATLDASASGTATHQGDIVEGVGAADQFLSVSASGTASQIFSGSGAPVATLSAIVVGGVDVTGYDGPTFIGGTGPLASTGTREIAWPGSNADPELSLLQEGDVAILFLGSKNETIGTPTPGAADSDGDTSNFEQVVGAFAGIGTAGAVAAARINALWCRATSHHMRSVIVPDPGNSVIAGMVVYRGVDPTGDPYDVAAGGTVSPASTELRACPDFTTLTINSRIVGAAMIALDESHPEGVGSGYTSTGVQNITERMDANFTTGNGVGLVVVDGEKLDIGATDSIIGTLDVSARSAYCGLALRATPAPTPSTGTANITTSLTATASGTAESVSNAASGAPVATLVATAEGTATVLNDATASGAAATSLDASASGTASSSSVGTITGSGSPVASLSASAAGFADTIKPIYPPRPPRDPAVGGRGRRIIYVEPEPETKEERPSRRRRPAAPPPTPEAPPLPAFEAPPVPAFSPYQFDPMLWRSLAAPTRPTVVTPDPREIEEEERFLAQLLETI